MKVIVFGATGMIGGGALIECIEDPRVTAVLVVGRKPCGVVNPKVRELIRSDFFDYGGAAGDFKGYDACFFCLGVSAVGMKEAEYHRVTFDMTVATAGAVGSANTGLTFCYISGEGADSTERGRTMWARVKGKTENHLMGMPLKSYALRPGFIQPRKGVRSKTAWYQAFYNVMGPFYPLLRVLLPRHVTTTEHLGRAMIALAAQGYAKRVLENPDINTLAER